MSVDTLIISSVRVLPRDSAQTIDATTCALATPATPLSLLDCTTANFLPTSAVWFFEKPNTENVAELATHLRDTLAVALNACPCWAGRLSAVATVDEPVNDLTRRLPPHARRFGRIHVRHGDNDDPGVEFVAAKSLMTVDELCPPCRPTNAPCWDRGLLDTAPLNPTVEIADALAPGDFSAGFHPVAAVQVTEFACGGYALAFKIAHCLADLSSVVTFMRHWASVSRAVLREEAMPSPGLVFDPLRLDSRAAGDINAGKPDKAISDRARALPFHRLDWWLSSDDAGYVLKPPAAFKNQQVQPAGKVMPWKDWSRSRPVSHYVLHFTSKHIQQIWAAVWHDRDGVSVHDAILAHVWSCVVRANDLGADNEPVYCDFSTNVRANLGLPKTFIGSPMVIVNAALPGREVASGDNLHKTARTIRDALTSARGEGALAAHLHDVAFEDSPQRLWQGFLGRRHMLVTSWARAGLYDVDFGLGCVRFVDSVLKDLDGIVLIKEAPPIMPGADWTASGVDVTLHLASDTMSALLADPMLFADYSRSYASA